MDVPLQPILRHQFPFNKLSIDDELKLIKKKKKQKTEKVDRVSEVSSEDI